MRRYVQSLLLLLLTANFSFSAEPEITGEKLIPQYSFAVLSIKIEAGDKAKWRVTPPPIRIVDKGDGNIYFSGVPGVTYRVEVDLINFKTEKWDKVSADVKFLVEVGPQPNPQPQPQPNPLPPVPPVPVPPIPPTPPIPDPPTPPVPPVPINADVWVIILEESSTRTPATAKVLGDLTFFNSLKTGNVIKGWRIFDPDSPDTKTFKYDKLADNEILKYKSKGVILTYPLVMLVNSSGDAIHSFTLPNDTATFRATLKTYLGR